MQIGSQICMQIWSKNFTDLNFPAHTSLQIFMTETQFPDACRMGFRLLSSLLVVCKEISYQKLVHVCFSRFPLSLRSPRKKEPHIWLKHYGLVFQKERLRGRRFLFCTVIKISKIRFTQFLQTSASKFSHGSLPNHTLLQAEFEFLFYIALLRNKILVLFGWDLGAGNSTVNFSP